MTLEQALQIMGQQQAKIDELAQQIVKLHDQIDRLDPKNIELSEWKVSEILAICNSKNIPQGDWDARIGPHRSE